MWTRKGKRGDSPIRYKKGIKNTYEENLCKRASERKYRFIQSTRNGTQRSGETFIEIFVLRET